MKSRKADFIIWTALAVILGLIVSFSFLPLLNVNPVEALQTMLVETFSDTYTMGNILVKTAPLILTGLAFAFTYKANLYNIGVQGQFYVGCICAVAVSLGLAGALPGTLVILLAMLAAMLGGGLTGLLIGFLKARFNASEFLVSMMSTYVITYVMQLLLRTVLQESKREYLKTDYIDSSVWLPKFLSGTSASIGIFIAVGAAILVWLILYKTALGYRIRVTGQNMDAARMAGINPFVQCMIAFAISGAIAGLAGFIEINGMQHMLLTDFDTDIGSYGIGIAILANANPIGIIFAALLFGVLTVGGTALGHSTDAPASTIDLMQGFVMLFVLMSFFFRKKIELNRMKKQTVGAAEGKEAA
ncbi:MAG: ABC transporter permease [Lachnospiraceae bacterium]|nr:ABC transporter permease [Lachnospiraceae bacterium]